MTAFRDPTTFPFVAGLEASFAAIRAELLALRDDGFVDSPDSLTAVADGYDERGWQWYSLFGGGDDSAAHRARCPATAAACAAVPGLVNAGFSRFLPGTHLYPHRGELPGVLRCHLALQVPAGDLGIAFGAERGTWREGRCLVFDDSIEHEAWNRTPQPRTVLLVTFAPAPPPANVD